MSVKINQFELENVKRIKAVKVELSENGLTVMRPQRPRGRRRSLTASRGPSADESIQTFSAETRRQHDPAEHEDRAEQWPDR